MSDDYYTADIVTEVPAGASKLFRRVLSRAQAAGLEVTMRQTSPTFISITVMDASPAGGWFQLCQSIPGSGRARHYASQAYTMAAKPVDLAVRQAIPAVASMADLKANRDERRAAAIEQAQQEAQDDAVTEWAAKRDARLEDASLAAQRAAVAEMSGPTVDAPADDEARVLSPMGGGRQVRRMTAEIRAMLEGPRQVQAIDIAQALYDAGFRATDPGYFGSGK